MAKKDFKGGMDALFGQSPTETKDKGKPKASPKEITKTSQEVSQANETRATFIIKEDLLDRVKNYAYWERLQIKQVVNMALEKFLEDKKIKPRPQE